MDKYETHNLINRLAQTSSNEKWENASVVIPSWYPMGQDTSSRWWDKFLDVAPAEDYGNEPLKNEIKRLVTKPKPYKKDKDPRLASLIEQLPKGADKSDA